MESNYKKLKIWQESINLSVMVYKLIDKMPIVEKYVLTDQLRRAVTSIPSNIAEGAGRGTTPQFVHFLNIAQGSAYEAETQLILCGELNYFSSIELENVLNKLNHIQRMNFKLKQSLTKR